MKEIKYNLISKGVKRAYKEGKKMGFRKENHPKTEFKHGHKVWNNGLTKETDERLLKASKQQSKVHIGEEWTEKRKKTHKKGMKNLWHKLGRKHPRGSKGKNWEVKDSSNYSTLRKLDWQNNDYVRKQIKARNVKQNKTEKKIENILNRILLNEYKFVGDGEFILGGKNPDFININGQKKLIELYGNYWHKGQNPQDRIDYFKKFGFNTLVIWESELKSLLKLKEKILIFNKI